MCRFACFGERLAKAQMSGIPGKLVSLTPIRSAMAQSTAFCPVGSLLRPMARVRS